MLIEVTQEDIEFGEPGCPAGCPIATAVRRETGRLVQVGVQLISIWNPAKNDWDEIPQEPKVKEFRELFDDEGPTAVLPFSFELAYTSKKGEAL